MKTLLLIRHAKSDWDNASLSDFERPLNERGKRDAPMMGRRLYDRNIPIDAFISSPAKRAMVTATLIAAEYDVVKERIVFVDDLYLATPDIFQQVVQNIDDHFQCAAVFSHNPGITDFANLLTNTRIDNMPTCSIFAVQIHADKWSDVLDAEKEFLFFDRPKGGVD